MYHFKHLLYLLYIHKLNVYLKININKMKNVSKPTAADGTWAMIFTYNRRIALAIKYILIVQKYVNLYIYKVLLFRIGI